MNNKQTINFDSVLNLNSNELYLNINGVKIKLNDEEIVRILAKYSFTEETWDISEWSEEWKILLMGRKNVNREEFINAVVKAFIKKEVINLTYDEWHRGIGKSHFINEISKVFEMPIISKKCYDRRDCYAVYTVDGIMGTNTKEVLVDEDISIDTIYRLRENGFKVFGFVTTYSRYDFV